MKLYSTRDPQKTVNAAEAIVRGLAPGGGLYIPENFPKADLEGWKSLSYPELTEKVLAALSGPFVHMLSHRR